MSPNESRPNNNIVDAKQAIFDKIFNENQDLRNKNQDLNRTLNKFDKLIREREEQHKRFEELEEKILKADNLNALASEIQKHLASEFAIPIANIALLDSVKKSSGFEFQNIIKPVSSESEPNFAETIASISESDYDRLFPNHAPIVTLDPDPVLISMFESVPKAASKIASSAFIPLLSRARTVGILNLASPDPKKFVPGTATDAVESLGRKLATVIENNLLTSQLQKLLRTDPLTKLYNRRVLDELLPIEFARSSRYKYPLSLVMIDLDDFKPINDTYGHAVGDLVLQEFGTLINNNLRQHDVGIRYGGDEFTIILPNTNYQQAQKVIEKIIKQVAENEIIIDENTKIKFGMSTGLATFPDFLASSAADLQEAADNDLYEIKKSKKAER